MDKSNQAEAEYRAVGVMSGSSLDGLDVCAVTFYRDSRWSFNIDRSTTVEIPNEIANKLALSGTLTGQELITLDVTYGRFIGSILSEWLEGQPKPSVIGVHGHTVFHEPDKGFSLQIGRGQAIALETGIPVVDDFRTSDILLGGQGAPLVPFGEHELFDEYQSFINLGGIANISIHNSNIVAWDVAPCNQVFNHLARKKGMPFDDNGEIARSGSLDHEFLKRLNGLAYFSTEPPKSLSNQWTDQVVDILPSNDANAMHTYAHFLAKELAKTLDKESGSVLVTGGGAYNGFLIEQLRLSLSEPSRIVIPNSSLINFKEAIIFAFMGLKRLLGETNILCSVTGSSRNNISGTLHPVA